MKKGKRILICPLEWGLGHASRCIPVIRQLLMENHEVMIAASGGPLALLQQEFPDLEFVHFESYTIHYSKRFPVFNLLKQVPKILLGIRKEHQKLKTICKEKKIEVVISDNRFGCWNPHLPSIFITHQVFIRSPFLQEWVQRFNFYFLRKYQRIWIPDKAETPNFSGALSHGEGLPEQAEYIGILSRFTPAQKKKPTEYNYKICVLLSGPEPQRTLLEELLIKQISNYKIKSIVLRGLPGEKTEKKNTEHITFHNHLGLAEMQKAVESAELVISRSGYSTVMDLAILEKKAIFIPTPSQTEQEYLAASFKDQKICYSEAQNEFDLLRSLEESNNYAGFERFKAVTDLSALKI